MVTHGSIEVLTKEYNCLVKITDDIRQVVEKSKIRNGVVYVITAHTTTGSLSPTFVPAPPVGVAVKLPSAFALFEWFPTILREPLSASDTLSEATAPVKLPVRHCPPAGSRLQVRNPVL